MKKFIFFIVAFLLIPFNIYAAEISSTSISGMTEKTIGEELSLSFGINFSGIQKGNNSSVGIWIVGFEISFDEDVFVVTGISSTDFESIVYKEDGKYYVLSEVIENGPSHNNCSNGVLYCADYLTTIQFFVKNTSVTSSTIKMQQVEVGLLDMVDSSKTYTTDDIISISTNSIKSHTITIKQPTSEVTTIEPTTSVTTKNNSTVNSSKITVQVAEITKSSNALLSTLQIENYNINFDKNTKEYTINVDENVNQLNVTAATEDSKSSYKIIGADDLKNNNYQVNVKVTAEDNTQNTYTIHVKLNNKQQETSTLVYKNEEQDEKKSFVKLDKNFFIYVGIGLGIIIIIIIIISLIIKRKNKKIDSLLDEL